MYLPKLHENILINYRLNLVKEFAIVFKHGLQTTSGFSASFSAGLLNLLNPTVILAFSSPSVLYAQRYQHMIIKRIVI